MDKKKSSVYFGFQSADFIDGVFNSKYLYLIPQPVKEAWHNYILYKTRQRFTESRMQLSKEHNNLLVRDVYVQEYNFYKINYDIINRTFPTTIKLTYINHPKISKDIETSYKTIKSILEKEMNDVKIKLMDLFKN